MAIFKFGDDYADPDFWLLCRHLKLLDTELLQINAAIATSRDPDSDGFLDTAEYFIGHGFVAIQRYLTATRTGLGIDKMDAFDVAPVMRGGLSFVAAINAAANYWKHVEEWVETIHKTDGAELSRSALRTLQQVETLTPWAEYTCANLMAVLLEGEEFELSGLLPKIEEWRDNLFAQSL